MSKDVKEEKTKKTTSVETVLNDELSEKNKTTDKTIESAEEEKREEVKSKKKSAKKSSKKAETENKTNLSDAEAASEPVETVASEHVEETPASESNNDTPVFDNDIFEKDEIGLSDSEIEEMVKEVDDDSEEEDDISYEDNNDDIGSDDSETKADNDEQQKKNLNRRQLDNQTRLFLQSTYSGSEVVKSEEVWNIIDSLRRSKIVIPVTMIGTEVKQVPVEKNGEKKKNYLLYAVFQLPKPFDTYPVYISYNDFYTGNERNRFANKANIKRGTLEKVNFQKNCLNRHIGFTCEIIITHNDKDTRLIYGSRTEALKRRFHQYFVKGVRMSNGETKKISEGAIVKGCPITWIAQKLIGVDVCGIPTTIGLNEISHEYITSPSEIYSPGDIVDVLILNIKRDGESNEANNTQIIASIKQTKENTTLKALREESKNNTFNTNVLGTIKYYNEKKGCYHILTDKGYNCIAFFSKDRPLNDNFGKATTSAITPKVGMKVIVRPSKYLEQVMLGTIVRCWW